MVTINGVKNEVRTLKSPIVINGGNTRSLNGLHSSSYDKWRMNWNGNQLAPPEVGSVLYYPGMPGFGATTFDFSGSSNHGTIVGATWVRLPSGIWTLRYDGDDYVNIDVAVNDLAATTKGTWMGWVKLDDATPATIPIIISFGDTDAVEFINFGIATTGKLYAQCNDAGTNQWVLETNAQALADGVYAHIALIQDGVEPVLLVNGVAVPQTFTTSTNKTRWLSVLTGVDNGRIGCFNINSASNANFLTNGNTALTTIINTNLTVARVQNIYNEERHLF